MVKMNALGWVCMILVLIGALNWGLVGLFDFDLVGTIFGDMTALSRIVYTVVGIAAVVMIVLLGMGCKKSEASAPAQQSGV